MVCLILISQHNIQFKFGPSDDPGAGGGRRQRAGRGEGSMRRGAPRKLLMAPRLFRFAGKIFVGACNSLFQLHSGAGALSWAIT